MPTRRNKTEQQPRSVPFEWTAPRERAAVLLAEDNLTDEQIAAELEIGRTTLHRWRQNAAFQQRVADQVEKLRVAVAKLSISERVHRVRALENRWHRMHQVIEARAVDPTMQDVPGGTTGLLVRTYKAIGHGEDFQVLPEFAVDTGLLRELRAHEEQAARELGQWIERQTQDLTSAGQAIQLVPWAPKTEAKSGSRRGA